MRGWGFLLVVLVLWSPLMAFFGQKYSAAAASYFQLPSWCLNIPMKHSLSCMIHYLNSFPWKISQTKFGCSLYLTSEFLMNNHNGEEEILLRTCRYNYNTTWPPSSLILLECTCGLCDRAVFACISRWIARSLYARANFSGLWLLLLLSVTRVCSMEVRNASTGSRNSKSLSGSGKRSFQMSIMLSSVLNKETNSLHSMKW